MAYDARYSQPCHVFPETQITMDRMIWAWEKLRDLNTAGYRSSRTKEGAREGMPTWLIGINWAGGSSSGPSAVPGTSCSPMTVQAMMMALSTEQQTPFNPKHSDGHPVSALYNTLANGNFRTSNAGHMRMARALGITDIGNGDNGWARANIFFNFAYAVEPKDMRRGDIVGISWMNGGGHATYCWDVHLNSRGEVDAFQYVSSNGSLAPTAEDTADGVAPVGRGKGYGVSVGGGAMGGQFIREVRPRVGATAGEYRKVKSPYFADDDRFVSNGGWTSWDPAVVAAGGRGLTGTRVPVRVSVTRCRSVKVARPFGIRPSEPYAMGGNPVAVTAHTPDVNPQQVNAAVLETNPAQVQPAPVAQDAARPTAGQLELETRLKMLYELRIIDKDPGVPDNVNDDKSREAVKDFQTRSGLRPTGNADTATKNKLRDRWTAARNTPEGRNYIATGRGTREAAGGGGGTAPAQAGGTAPAQAAPAPAAPAQAAPAPAAPAQAAPAPAPAGGAAPAQAGGAAPAQAGGAAPAQAGGAAAPAVDMYFRHGFARPGDAVAVHLVVTGRDGQSFPLKLKNAANGEIRDTGARLTLANGQAAVSIRIPAAAAAGQAAGQAAGGGPVEYVGVAEGIGETGAPLYVAG